VACRRTLSVVVRPGGQLEQLAVGVALRSTGRGLVERERSVGKKAGGFFAVALAVQVDVEVGIAGKTVSKRPLRNWFVPIGGTASEMREVGRRCCGARGPSRQAGVEPNQRKAAPSLFATARR